MQAAKICICQQKQELENNLFIAEAFYRRNVEAEEGRGEAGEDAQRAAEAEEIHLPDDVVRHVWAGARR